MKMEDIKKIVPLIKKEDVSLPLEGLSEKERESMYYGDLADSQLNSIWYQQNTVSQKMATWALNVRAAIRPLNFL